jgi:hypothetical protein
VSARLVLLDSAAAIGATHRGAVVITGSHGGVSAARYARAFPPALVVFNDAGRGKGDAGIAGLALLQAEGIAAATVAHDSARIGEAADTLANGVLSAVNAAARERFGLAPGLALASALRAAGVAV